MPLPGILEISGVRSRVIFIDWNVHVCRSASSSDHTATVLFCFSCIEWNPSSESDTIMMCCCILVYRRVWIAMCIAPNLVVKSDISSEHLTSLSILESCMHRWLQQKTCSVHLFVYNPKWLDVVCSLLAGNQHCVLLTEVSGICVLYCLQRETPMLAYWYYI